MPKRVLFSGVSGFIGSNVLEYLLDNTDWEFTCLCSWRHHGNPLNVPANPRVTVVSHDLTGTLPHIGSFDYIVHLASESHVDRSILDPVNFIENNVSSTLQMLEYARKHPMSCKVFLLFSTDEVWGERTREDWPGPLPSSPYSASKAAQEMIAVSYWRTYGVPLVITNSANVIGKNQHPEKFVPKVADLIRKGNKISIHAINHKPGLRLWNPVENIAEGIKRILALRPKPYPRQELPWRVALPGSTQLDNLEMAKVIANVLDREFEYELVDPGDIRPGYDKTYPHVEGNIQLEPWEYITVERGLLWLKSQ